ncbi:MULTISPECIES: peptidoglycan DD-metalloendopeptidase family protein [unclassified Mucilaginibacter]|uniref:murein hydrolase activator EnvC family protein n=1 Tax=unclassified Mucilaginibacter TaxID=2617802 RepID=UPI002AC931FB|nr:MULTISPECIES: peptidoglycan DD-metalloendopeptidase family protein [unclassified Mucilaginibacter]MEB0260467.1 peptidoglycan DD-metalloendopeptidase family protein [Mucilaginibacter sp. 10I4]MEB0280049.1 peptidoglycan DD-metalloendopeptidase family protein [Mucilaginibacter sp. 10B2]MEB0302570.1 peptidoglycan DD-metalloendopeptidase family protein [Mucilaginibacter sp. 5C4]WPX23609.1 peptidoglycan DD-metalloendopeptidase family protein [Mucilaginibacter sp. 5C4]
MKFFRAALFFVLMLAASGVFAQSSAELKRRRDKLTDELDHLNREFDETKNNKKVSLKQLNILKAQINLREEKITNINSEVRNLDNQISESNNTVHSLQNQLDQLKKEYAGMVLFAYRNQSAYNKLMFIFAAKDFNQAYRRLKYLQQFGTYRERQAGYIQGTQKDLHVKIVELDKDKKEKNNLLQSQEKEKKELGKAKNNQVKVITDLSKHQGELKTQQRDVQKRLARNRQEIVNTIRREIEEARRKAEAEAREAARIAAAKAKAENREVVAPTKKAITKTSTNSEVLNSTPEAAKLSNDFLGNKGRLPWPVATGQLVHGFGTYNDDGIRNESNGYEIRTNTGAPVRAVFEGEVKTIMDISGTYLVIIKHGEYFTAYQNLRTVNVSKGQKVSTKQMLGTVALDPSTGDATTIFTLSKSSTFVDPRLWLAPN